MFLGGVGKRILLGICPGVELSMKGQKGLGDMVICV